MKGRTRTYDFTNFTFRCSELGTLMTGAKPRLTVNQEAELERLYGMNKEGKITDKQVITLGDLLDKKMTPPKLSATTITRLNSIHKEAVFGKVANLDNKFLQKGLLAEESSISLYSRLSKALFLKNKERRTNEYITGEPDNADGIIRDVKTSWSMDTFPMADDTCPSSDYWWQLQGYMELWDMNKAELIYCLVNTPEILIDDEKRRQSWKLGYIDLPEDVSEAIENNMTFDDVPEGLRCRVFIIDRDRDAIKMLYDHLDRCREYLNERTKAIAALLPELTPAT